MEGITFEMDINEFLELVIVEKKNQNRNAVKIMLLRIEQKVN